MLRTLAYIIFLCTGLLALTLIVLFFRSGNGLTGVMGTTKTPAVLSVSRSDTKTLTNIEKEHSFVEASQKDVFGAFIFTFPVEIQSSGRVRMYTFENDYSLIRRNMRLLGALYDFQDTNDFYGKTMFLNDKTGNTSIIRFITEIRGTTYGFEVLRDEYEHAKSLILR